MRDLTFAAGTVVCLCMCVFAYAYHCTVYMPHSSLPLSHPSLAVRRVKWTTKVRALYLITPCT